MQDNGHGVKIVWVSVNMTNAKEFLIHAHFLKQICRQFMDSIVQAALKILIYWNLKFIFIERNVE